MFHALRDSGLGDLVERDPVLLVLIQAEQLCEMPGDGLSLAVGVRCEIHIVIFRDRILQLFDKLFLSLDDRIFRFKVVFYVDVETGGRQVTHMAHGGGDIVVIPQHLLDGPNFRRRLHNNEIRHRVPF